MVDNGNIQESIIRGAHLCLGKNLARNRIDQAIFESEQEIANGTEAVDAEIFFAELEKVLLSN